MSRRMELLLHLIFKYAGITAIPVYIAFTLAAHLHNPAIDPMNNWLSDYGNPLLNPGGAEWYNAGCVVTALLLAVFYIGMIRWYGKDRSARKFNISFAVAQASGLAGSVFLILTTVFPIGMHTELHSAFSQANMMAMDFFLCFTGIGFLMNRQISRGIGLLGFATSTFNVITMNAFSDFYLSEWIYFLAFMVYLVLVSRQTDLLIKKNMETNTLSA